MKRRRLRIAQDHPRHVSPFRSVMVTAATSSRCAPTGTTLPGSDNYFYDVRGNLSQDDGFDDDGDDFFEYSYDPDNRLTSVDYDPGSSTLTKMAEYRYDNQGRRVEFVNSPPDGVTRTLHYYYDGPNVIAEYEYDAATLTGTRTSTARSTWTSGR